MGGYGAVRLGLKYPDRFSSIWSHSGAFHIGTTRTEAEIADLPGADIRTHADCTVEHADRPILSLDCGTEDELIHVNRELHTHLETIGYPHTYAEHPGAHDWTYWDTHVVEALAQHARVLGIEQRRAG